MSKVFTECGVPGCPRDTTGYCEKCANPHGVGSELTYSQGYQAGLRRAAEVAENSTYWPLEGADIAKEILKEIEHG